MVLVTGREIEAGFIQFNNYHNVFPQSVNLTQTLKMKKEEPPSSTTPPSSTKKVKQESSVKEERRSTNGTKEEV